MQDLHSLEETFATLACFVEVWGSKTGERLLHNEVRKLNDPHPDADAWLAAPSEEERSRVQAKAEARHKLVQAELARSIRKVTKEQHLERKRLDMAAWRRANHRAHLDHCNRWKRANREYVGAYMREWRRNLDPEAKAAYLAAGRERKKRAMELRRAHRAANPLPPRPKMSDKERRLRSREWNRKYLATRTEEQRLARNTKQAERDRKRKR